MYASSISVPLMTLWVNRTADIPSPVFTAMRRRENKGSFESATVTSFRGILTCSTGILEITAWTCLYACFGPLSLTSGVPMIKRQPLFSAVKSQSEADTTTRASSRRRVSSAPALINSLDKDSFTNVSVTTGRFRFFYRRGLNESP